MSHDRGCACGREAWDYRSCPRRRVLGGSGCRKEVVIRGWDDAGAADFCRRRELESARLRAVDQTEMG